ncbi:MAG: GGDEF domain-containing protein [Lachnospiraceae bacterium]|nr:GGDEF domain-containing protein [Lachnospiraceae bacterium]
MDNGSNSISTIDNGEAASNRFTLKCQVIMTIIVALSVVLNILDIFIIQDKLMYYSLIGGTICTVISALVVKFMADKPITKYILMIIMVLFVTVIGSFLTYHIVLVSVIPILCSAQYKNNKLINFSYVISVISIFAIVMAGFYFGICDANMLVLTNQVKDNHIDPITGQFVLTTVNANPWGTLPLYYALPRCLVLFATIPMIKHLSNVITQNARRETELKILGETDMMTQLYNRNKYLELIHEYYPNVDNVGIMFWDIDGLKNVNDTMGHDSGDYLITAVTSSILEFTKDRCKAFRIGGDEFVIIGENLTREDIGEMVVNIQSSIDKKDKLSKISISASVGYAVGAGKDIEKIVAEADACMYKNKQNHYELLKKEGKVE